MNPRSILLLCALFLGSDGFAELSPHSCSLLRNIGSLTRIVPELSELAMRFYRPETAATTNQRLKRSTKEQNQQIKGTMIEQLIANTIRDVNFTNVALLILSSNETKSKIEKNVDFDLIIRSFIRGLDHEKLTHAILKSVQTNFDLEHFIESSINHTQMNDIHDQLLNGGQLPEWLLTSIHPNLTNSVVRRMRSTIQNLTEKFVKIFTKFERVDSFMFNILMQQTLIPMNYVVERVKERKPKNFDQLLETMINTTKKILTEPIIQPTQRTTTALPKKTSKGPASDEDSVPSEHDQAAWMLYQWSIAFSTMGQTASVLVKSLEHLYCTSVWD